MPRQDFLSGSFYDKRGRKMVFHKEEWGILCEILLNFASLFDFHTRFVYNITVHCHNLGGD